MPDTEESALEELEALALEGLNSGEPFEPTPNYWREKHRRLNENPLQNRDREGAVT